MNKQLKISNNQELEAYLTSFTNLVNRYCTHPDRSCATLIKSTYLDILFNVSLYAKTLATHDQERTNAVKTKFNYAYGRFLDKKEDGYKKVYRY